MTKYEYYVGDIKCTAVPIYYLHASEIIKKTEGFVTSGHFTSIVIEQNPNTPKFSSPVKYFDIENGVTGSAGF